MKGVVLAFLWVVALLLAVSQAAFWLASQQGAHSSEGRGCAVPVLGYPANSDGTTNSIQRFRVRSAVEVYREHGCSKLVLSGGAVQNGHVEAESMAALAKSLGVPMEDMVLETSARSTWENVGCTAALTPSVDRVLVVSDSLHAKRATRYACRQDPALCERFLAAGVAPSIVLAWWGIPAAANELRVFITEALRDRDGAAEHAARCASGGVPL